MEKFPADGSALRWTAKLGGGYSGPSVADGRVFVMDRVGAESLRDGELLHKQDEAPRNENFLRRRLPGKERVLCLDESNGEVLWKHEYDCPYTTVALYAIGPRCTPTVDGNFVYALGAEGNLFCVRVNDGSVVWSKDFQRDYQMQMPEWGVAAHPLVDGDRLICVVGVRDGHIYACGNGGRYICAKLDSGGRLWSTFEPSTGNRPAAWANVFTIQNGDRYFHANDLGDLIISKMSPSGYKEISRAHLIEPTHAVSGRVLVWSHPAFANRSVYLRNDGEMRCYSLKQ